MASYKFTATLALMIEDFNNAAVNDRWETKERLAVATAIAVIGQLSEKSRTMVISAAIHNNPIAYLPEFCTVKEGIRLVDGFAYEVATWGEQIYINGSGVSEDEAHNFCLNDKQVDDEIRAAKARYERSKVNQ